jgi:hybrid cluster-associated redox disulfide protein
MITREMTVAQALKTCPCLHSVLGQLGLACCHCLGAETDTIEQVARVYGLDPEIVVHTLNVASLFPPGTERGGRNPAG